MLDSCMYEPHQGSIFSFMLYLRFYSTGVSSACTVCISFHKSSRCSGFLVANSETGDFCIVTLCYLNGDCNFILMLIDYIYCVSCRMLVFSKSESDNFVN